MFLSLGPARAFPGLVGILLFAGMSASSQTVASSTPTAPLATSSAAVTFPAASKPASPATSAAGWNFAVTEGVEHDSSTGWSDIVTPDLSLHPGPHASLDASIPWYPSLAAYVSTTANGVTTTTLTQAHNIFGDATVAAHLVGNSGNLTLTGGAAVGFATGDRSLGVSAGQTTYHIGTRAEDSLGIFTPDIEAGIGNSSTFANRSVLKSYTAVGEIANFQTGTSIDLPKQISLDLQAYEAMPVQLATVFGTINRRGNSSHAGGRKTVQGSSTTSAEDNGFTAGFSFPVARRLAFSMDYEHSLIQAEDIVGISLTWVLHAPRRAESVPASPLSR